MRKTVVLFVVATGKVNRQKVGTKKRQKNGNGRRLVFLNERETREREAKKSIFRMRTGTWDFLQSPLSGSSSTGCLNTMWTSWPRSCYTDVGRWTRSASHFEKCTGCLRLWASLAASSCRSSRMTTSTMRRLDPQSRRRKRHSNHELTEKSNHFFLSSG